MTMTLTRARHGGILASPMGTPKDKGVRIRRDILSELIRREKANLPSPTWEELGEAITPKIDRRTTLYHARILVAAGMITFTPGRTRTVRTTPEARAKTQ